MLTMRPQRRVRMPGLRPWINSSGAVRFTCTISRHAEPSSFSRDRIWLMPALFTRMSMPASLCARDEFFERIGIGEVEFVPAGCEHLQSAAPQFLDDGAPDAARTAGD